MERHPQASRLFDTRAYLYRAITQILIILGAGILIKLAVIDIVTIQSDQMEPSVLKGDRILIFKTPYIVPFKSMIHPAPGKPVLFRKIDQSTKNCLRIAGFSRDTVEIDSGIFRNSRKPLLFSGMQKPSEVLPPNFSPRDYFLPYRIPSPGDSIRLDSLSIRDFFFTLSIISQENPGKAVTFKPLVVVDGLVSTDYIISGFSLYKGTVEAIPDDLKNDWFFWYRLKSYLDQTGTDHSIRLSFSAMLGNSSISRYTVRKSYVFLLADNWSTGLDSRYFGPVRSTNILGRAFFVVWSHGKNAAEKAHLRINRFGRIVK